MARNNERFVGQDSQTACHDWYPVHIQDGANDSAVLNTPASIANGTECLGPDPRCRWANDHSAVLAVQFIWEHAKLNKPFFLYLSTTTPHIGHLGRRYGDGGGQWPTPLPYRTALPQNFSEIYHWTAMFASAVIAQDTIVGQVLDALAAAGLEESTAVFFSGDNGPDDHSFHTFDDVGPFRGKKRSLHEGGIRQTIAVQWKGTIPGKPCPLPCLSVETSIVLCTTCQSILSPSRCRIIFCPSTLVCATLPT